MSFSSKKKKNYAAHLSGCHNNFRGRLFSLEQQRAQLVKCASIITSLIMSSYDPGARFIDAPSGCCDRFIEMGYLRAGFMGRALFKDLTNPRSSPQFYRKHLFLPAGEDTVDESAVAPID